MIPQMSESQRTAQMRVASICQPSAERRLTANMSEEEVKGSREVLHAERIPNAVREEGGVSLS